MRDLNRSVAAPYELHGAALLDCYRGKTDAVLIVHQDGGRDDVAAEFWLRDAIGAIEEEAVSHCRGRVLDVGAGAGVHSLALQSLGIEVTAIDVSADCVTIMRERGVADARQADLFTLEGVTFDTLLCLCNGLDKVGTLAELPRFLNRMKTLLVPGGQLIVDSFDPRVRPAQDRKAAEWAGDRQGRYVGEMELAFEYEGRKSQPFSVLHVDDATLSQIASNLGWTCDVLRRSGAQYLARLRRTSEEESR